MSKLRNFKYAEDPHEMAESPLQEAQEHMPGGYEEGEEAGEGEGDIEQILNQLSPEELQQLAEELSSEMESPETQNSGEDVEGLAQAIQENLAQNPEASPEGLPPEKAAALETIKSASYIEGFLNEALDSGANLKQAVNLYDQTLTHTINNMNTSNEKTAGAGDMLNRLLETLHLRQPSTMERISRGARGMYGRASAGIKDLAGKASDAYGNLTPLQQKALLYGGGGLGAAGLGAGAYSALSGDENEKTSGIKDIKRWLSRGGRKASFKQRAGYMAEDATDKAKDIYRRGASQISGAAKNVKQKATQAYNTASDKAKELKKEHWTNASTGKKVGIGAAGAALAGGAGYGISKAMGSDGKKEKKSEYMKIASYCEGLMEQAIYNGFTPKQAEYLAQTAFEDLEKHAQLTTDTLDVLNHFLLENIG